ncbi:MAG: L-threonylcarbamoyladenylate synthase [Leadbetterella sp.]
MMVKIGTSVYEAAEILKNGGLVGIPTETVYGLAGNALDSNTILSIFETKNRPKFDPLIVHTYSLEKAVEYADIHPKLINLAEKFWPGPLTILASKKSIIPDLISSGLPQMALRVPNNGLTLELLRLLEFPLAAPSANPFGYISPTQAQHVEDQLGDKIPYILDGGSCHVGIESTIVGIENDTLTIYRTGGLSVEEIEGFYNEKVVINTHSSSDPLAPGMLKKHYSPNKTVKILPNNYIIDTSTNRVGVMMFSDVHPQIANDFNVVLSHSKSLMEASQSLFSALRELDAMDIDTIYLQLVPNVGLGRAINDRITRAAAED